MTRALPQPPQSFARSMPPQQPRQVMTRALPQSPQSFARSMPSQQPRLPMTRALPEPSQSFARSMPQAPRQFASPTVQSGARSAPQFSYNQQPRGQIQMAASHAQARDAGRGEANRMTMNSNPAHERGQR
jgi:hypothetical protein